MKIARCNNGHFYDADRFLSCPHCEEKYQFETKDSSNDVSINAPILYDTPNPILRENIGNNTFNSRVILPSELSDCTILDSIGKGALGDVYKIQRCIDYAIKVINWNKPNYHNIAKQEYQIAKLFDDSENIINYLEYYETDDTSYILQELAEPWINYCSDKNITVEFVLDALISICEALSVIHKKGYQHYDINPKNIFIIDNVVKIGDFSHSAKIDKGKKHRHCIGTYQFIAPEMLNYDSCSGTEDIYSLGITMYVMLTGGQLPYNLSAGKKISDNCTHINSDNNIDNKSIESFIRHKEDIISTVFLNSELVDIIEKATSYEAANRYQSVTEIINDIQLFKKKYKKSMNEIIRKYDFDDEHNYYSYNWNHNTTAYTMGTTFIKPLTETDISITNLTVDSVDTESESKTTMDDDTVCDTNLSVDSVRFSIITEKSVEKNDIGIIEVAMFTDEFENQVIDSIKKEFSNEILSLYSHYVDVNNNTNVTVQLQSNDIMIEEDNITYKWNGRYLKFSFDYYVPENFKRRRALVKAFIYFNNVIAVTMKFVIDIVQKIVIDEETHRTDIKTAYMSYAREDINEATYILQGIKKARNDLDIFFDIENLRSGDDWQKKLYDELSQRDILFLCWSHYAAASKWVQREVKYVLDNKGTDAIRPIPLERTIYSDLPEELKSLHFNDIELLIRDAYSQHKKH